MRADRLISIILRLQNKPLMTARELAKELEVSERTIYRDIDALSAAGVPIRADAGLGGGFSLPPDYRTKADGLNKADIQALFLLMNEQPFKQLGIGSSLKSALLKIFNALPQRLQEDAEWIQNRLLVDMEGWSRYREQETWLQLAQQAVWEQQSVRVEYTDRRGHNGELGAEPYGLVLKAGIWFLIGGCDDGEVRAFRLSRIKTMRLEDRRFERPEGLRLEALWREWVDRYDRKRYAYETVLDADERGLDGIVRHGGWIQAEKSEDNGRRSHSAGQTRVFFENERAALSAVLAQAGGVAVVSPPELRRRLYEQALALTAEYGESAPPGDS